MRKIVLSAAMVLALYSCKNSGNESKDSSATATTAKTEQAPPPAATSIVGKWRAVDEKFEGTPDPKMKMPTDEEMRANMQKDTMIYEFLADGTANMYMKGMPVTKLKYKKSDNKIEMTDEKGTTNSMEIAKLADNELDLRVEVEGTKFLIIMNKN